MVWNLRWLWCLGGGSGVRLKSNGSLIWSYVDSQVLRWGWRRIFRGVVTWRSSQSHRCMGKFLSVLIIPTIKWFLKVFIDCSAGFLRCKFGRTSWNSTNSSLINIFRPAGDSLSNFCRIGWRPFYARDVWTMVYAHMSSPSDLFFIGSVSITLLP